MVNAVHVRRDDAAPAHLDREGSPARPADLAALSQVGFTTPAHINRLVFKGIGEVTLPTSVQAENGEADRALVLGGLGWRGFPITWWPTTSL